jgi:GTP-binding protein
MFVDKVTITVRAGAGGNGAIAFHREKYVAAGGPDGGDGGRGGNIVVVVDPSMSTLLDFRYKRKFVAPNGMPGQGKRCSGKDGEDVILRVPKGTLLRDKQSGSIIQDMSATDRFVLARGGRGGWGNKHFATPTRQTPHFAKPGLPGEYREVVLELKLLADVGLVGFPNVGKSTILSVVSRAHPKIANYPFTTLYPNLGVVYAGPGVSFVMADIPGIIEGASEGAGLGHDFLRHIDRCRLLIHVVDVSGSEGRDPIEDFEAINTELKEYNPELASRPQLVVANKCDLLGDDREPLDKFKAYVQGKGYEFFEISAAAHQGLSELTMAAAGHLAQLPPVTVFEADYVAPEVKLGTAEDLTIEKYDDVWSIQGDWLDRLVARVNFSDYESRMYLDRKLREAGVYDRMEEMGLSDGDIISIAELHFEYYS